MFYIYICLKDCLRLHAPISHRLKRWNILQHAQSDDFEQIYCSNVANVTRQLQNSFRDLYRLRILSQLSAERLTLSLLLLHRTWYFWSRHSREKNLSTSIVWLNNSILSRSIYTYTSFKFIEIRFNYEISETSEILYRNCVKDSRLYQ